MIRLSSQFTGALSTFFPASSTISIYTALKNLQIELPRICRVKRTQDGSKSATNQSEDGIDFYTERETNGPHHLYEDDPEKHRGFQALDPSDYHLCVIAYGLVSEY